MPLNVIAAGLVTPVIVREVFSSMKYNPFAVLLVIRRPDVPPVESEYLILVRLIVIELPAAVLAETTFEMVRVNLSAEREQIKEELAPEPAEQPTLSLKREIGELADGFQYGTLITSKPLAGSSVPSVTETTTGPSFPTVGVAADATKLELANALA